MIVCKFGGTSVANAETAQKIKDIIKTNKNRRIIVVSALGKSQGKIKITDILFKIDYCIKNYEDFNSLIDELFLRYKNLSESLNVNIDWAKYKQALIKKIQQGEADKEYIVSRGEYYSALLYAKFLQAKFLDAKDYIKFEKNGKFSEKLTKKCLKTLKNDNFYVIGGFYGQDANGNICTFDRGGSDITGAIICKLLDCEIYENYTDVDGVYDKNPALFPNANKLPLLNFKTAIDMAKSGNEVVHIDALKIMKGSKGILLVKSTFLPQNLGTIVVLNSPNFNNLFICCCKIWLVEFSGDNKTLDFIKQCGSILKVFKGEKNYYAIMTNLYVSSSKLISYKNILHVEQKEMFSFFSNVVIGKSDLIKLNRLIKNLKKYDIYYSFLSYKNNLTILADITKKDFIVRDINNVLKKQN